MLEQNWRAGQNNETLTILIPRIPIDLGVPNKFDHSEPIILNGHLARRRAGPVEKIFWDHELTGFGLRTRPNGRKTWIVKFRARGRQIKRTLGRVEKMSAWEARQMARKVLGEAATAGLPKRQSHGRTVPDFAAYATEFWRDYSRHWKPTTQKTSLAIIVKELIPVFGQLPVDQMRRADVMRWRDSLVQRQGTFNRALPVLSRMMQYAEQLGYRVRGSNPARNMTCYPGAKMERYLNAEEYRRLGRVLAETEASEPDAVAILRLLMFTGARSGEILQLRWRDVKPPRLHLPDSKSGPKMVYLNSQAQAVLQGLRARRTSDWVFPCPRTTGPRKNIWSQWQAIRRAAALPEVRIHDLRHSFASAAINRRVSLAIIGRLLGHALIETTARYAHLEDQSILEAAARVSRSLGSDMGLGQ